VEGLLRIHIAARRADAIQFDDSSIIPCDQKLSISVHHSFDRLKTGYTPHSVSVSRAT
jgi:hypothetical protein